MSDTENMAGINFSNKHMKRRSGVFSVKSAIENLDQSVIECEGLVGGKLYTVGDGYFYAIHVTKTLGCQYLRCHTRSCRGSAKMISVNEIKTIIPKHQHSKGCEPNFLFMQTLSLRKRIINRCKAEITSLRQIFYEECNRELPAVASGLTYPSLLSAMKRARRKVLPPIPNSTNSAADETKPVILARVFSLHENSQVYETNIEDDENGVSNEPNKLVIQSKDEEEEPTVSFSKEDQFELKVKKQYETEEPEGIIDDEFEQPNAKEPKVTILEGEGQTEQCYDDNYESGNAFDEYLDCQEQFLCHVCGVENCGIHRSPNHQKHYFVCLVCSGIFPSKYHLAIHSKTHVDISEDEAVLLEKRKKILTCEFCGRVLPTKAILREHIMTHIGEKPYKCLLCGKSFRRKANLVVHVNVHTIVRTYKCKECNKAFIKKMDFENHLQNHVDESGNSLVCNICNAVFKSKKTLYNHSNLHSRNGKKETAY